MTRPAPASLRAHYRRAGWLVAAAGLVVGLYAAPDSSPIRTPVAQYVQTTNVYDSMDRYVPLGFGAADEGGAYTTWPRTAFSVSAGAGHIAPVQPGLSVRATFTGTSPADEELQSTFSLPALPTRGVGVYYGHEFRRQGNGDDYRVLLQVRPGGRMSLGFRRVRDGESSPIGAQVPIRQRATAGATVVLQGVVAGSTTVRLGARAWLSGTAVPDWQSAAEDTTADRLTGPGHIGLSVSAPSGSDAAAVSVESVQGWRLVAPVAPAQLPTAALDPTDADAATSTDPSGGGGPATDTAASVQPGPANTGVPAGTMLMQSVGNLVITTPGATYDSLDIHGFVTIEAPDVTITRSIIRGGVATASDKGLVTDTDPRATNFRVYDSELVPEHPSVHLDGIKGWNYTLTRVNIHGTVDGAKIFGDNTTIQNSWLHDTVAYPHDPYQGNGPTHNDAIQVLSGQHIHLTGNTVQGGTNSGLQITQDHGPVSDLAFTGNWADGGACTVNVADKPLTTMTGITVSDNQFGHASGYPRCAVVISAGVTMTATGNVWAGTTTPVEITLRS